MTSLICTFLEFLCIYCTFKSFLQCSLKPEKYDFIALLSAILAFEILPDDGALLAWSIGQVIFFLYMTYAYCKNFFSGLLLFCVSLGIVSMLQFLSAWTIKFIPTLFHTTLESILGNFITLILVLLLFCIKPIKDFYFKVLHSALPYRLMLINTYLIIIFTILVFKLRPSQLYSNIGIVLFITLFLALTNICLLYYDQKVSAQNQELLSYQKNLPIYESLINEIRGTQHEYSNRIQNLQSLAQTCKDYESLQTALEQYTQSYSKPLHAYPLLQIDMPLLAATLYNLASRAEQKEISIHFDIASKHLCSQATETQLADFASALTQNAIEACVPGDHIYVHLLSENNKVKFEIRNPVKSFYTLQDISKFFQKDFTTKEKVLKADTVPHGFGLYNLLKQVTKLHGQVGGDCIQYEDKYWIIFHLHI